MTKPALAISVVLTLSSAAVAQQRDDTDVLLLDALRLAFHESPNPLADAPGIHAVLLNGAAAWTRARRHVVTPHQFARQHSPHFFAGTSVRPWALNLDESCERPSGYAGNWQNLRCSTRACSGGPTLPSYRDVCLETVALLRRVGETPSCDAETWGSRADFSTGRFAAQHARDVFVDCGTGARNLFSRPPDIDGDPD